MKELKDKITFYVPSESAGKTIDNSVALKYVAEKLSARYGGCTVADAVGLWINGANELVAENIKLIYSYGNFGRRENGFFFLLATWLKQSLRQESVAYELNNKLILV